MKKKFQLGVHRSAFSGRLSDQRGIALILTLAIITLVTLMLIGFAVSMRVENSASKNFNEVVKARELAQAAMNQAIAQIREATTRGPGAGTVNVLNYVTFPGVIYDLDNSTAPPTAIRKPLYSALNAAAADNTNLNAVSDFWITSNNGEFTVDVNSQINAGWTTVLQDQTLPPGPNNPMVGRYAFWVDDEASKVNINTAGQSWAAPDPYGASDPLAVDLRQLLPLPFPFPYAADVESGGLTYPRATFPYTTVEEMRRVNAVMPLADFTANRFSVTAYSDDKEDLDVLGRKRLDITTLTEANDIIDIVGPDSAYTRLSDNTYLKNVYSSARAFAQKYQIANGVDGLKQIIANIITYRLNPRLPVDLAQIPDGLGNPPLYLGLVKAPYVNEVKVTYDLSPAGIERKVYIELFYPYAALDNSSFLILGNDTIEVSGLPFISALVGATPAPPSVTLPGGTIFNQATPYYTFLYSDETDPSFTLAAPTLLSGATATVNFKRSGKRFDCAQVPLPNVGLPIAGPACHGAEVNDPCDNEYITEWLGYRNCSGAGSGTMAAVPPGGLTAPATSQNSNYGAGGDTSKMYIRGSAMLAVGELGYIHKPGSWQHLQLQPQPAIEKGPPRQIPDWAMLDIFTIPNAKTQGRININSYINPGLAAPAPIKSRLVPLQALLNSIVPPGTLPTVAQNIYGNSAGPIYVNSPDAYGVVGAFDSIGEICEVLGIDNAGLNDADKEAVIRRIADILTVRSNTFTIWIIANSIKEVGVADGKFNGQDIVTGEVRAQAVVERIVGPGLDGVFGTPLGAPDDTVSFRVRYFRYF